MPKLQIKRDAKITIKQRHTITNKQRRPITNKQRRPGWASLQKNQVRLVQVRSRIYHVLRNVYEAIRVICGYWAGRGTLYKLQ